MGGNTFSRRYFSDAELYALIQEINGLKSLFSDRTFQTEKQFRANISRYLDHDSSNRFYFMIEQRKGLPSCGHCGDTLTIGNFHYCGWDAGFSKYCTQCTTNGVWRTNVSQENRKERGKKISKTKLAFYQTGSGKETAKSNGKKISKSLKKFYKTEEGIMAARKSAAYNSIWMKSNILSGKFTPNSNNKNTHWGSSYNGKKYRSSWEALYHYFYPAALYEKLRIPYKVNGKEHIYIVDYIDYTSNTVTEVKPRELCTGDVFEAKFNALCEWGRLNNFVVRLADRAFIRDLGLPDNLDNFDKNTKRKIKNLHEQIKN